MDFVLYYRGPLPANGDAKQKHRIREHFHRQLKTLWASPPFDRWLKAASDASGREAGEGASPTIAQWMKLRAFPSLIKVVEGHQYLPLVCVKLCAVAQLDLTLLRPEPAGRIVTQGGDIDNRIKTLLDALKVPDSNQGRQAIIGTPETPFHCLLEDDNLITRLSVRTDHLLEPPMQPNEVVAILHVKTCRTMELPYNHVIS
jgi:hypothetical protein